MTLKQILRAIVAVVIEEADHNSEFAQRLEGALGHSKSHLIVKKSNTRATAVMDPVAVLANQGEEALRNALLPLTLEQLLDIVAEFGMDSAKLVMKWKNSQRIIEHIISSAQRRSVKGDAFRI
jgi:hypothetical protein